MICLLLCYLHIACLILLRCEGAKGANVLISSNLGEGSHFLGATFIGESLVSRGHQVTFLIGQAFSHHANNPRYSKLFNFSIFQEGLPTDEVYKSLSKVNEAAFQEPAEQVNTLIEMFSRGGGVYCNSLLKNETLLLQLRAENYDVVIYDTLWPCAPLFSSKIGHVPAIGLVMVPMPSSTAVFSGLDHNPSYVPTIGLGLSNDMTFFQRVGNTLTYHFLNTFFRRLIHKPFDDLLALHDIYSPSGNIDALLYNSSLWFVNADFAVEFPCSLPPSVIPVGGLTTHPSSPLSPDLEEFVQSSGEDGVIICTMGTYVKGLPDKIIHAFASAFSRLPQKIIWQLPATPSNVNIAGNIKVLPWVPQNDLLGHHKTRALLFPGGNNGFYEALYHGVPMVILPLLSEQFDVAARATTNGLGITLDKSTVTSGDIIKALQDVTRNPSFREEAARRSAIFRSMPMRPAERAAFWIEHVIRFGGEYFRLPATKYGFIRNSLLDVHAFILVTVLFMVLLLYCSLRWLYEQCSRLFVWKKELKQD